MDYEQYVLVSSIAFDLLMPVHFHSIQMTAIKTPSLSNVHSFDTLWFEVICHFVIVQINCDDV